MRQLTLRLPDELVSTLKDIASSKGTSLNAWATLVLTASADPELAGDEAFRLRERFERAGLLLVHRRERPIARPPSREVERARAAAGKGSSLAEHVREGRR